jgi:t-SNARE complex subunit (syntaxin)
MTKKIKRQLKNAKKDATEDELDSLARNPEEAQKVMQSYLVGKPTHQKVVNAVEDI